jgi:DNA-binding NarL/FixJ family response regulator
MSAIRLIVADDHMLVRAGVRKLLELMNDVEVVGETGDGAAVVDLAALLRPDVVLLDINMPGQNGLEVTARLTKTWPDVRVLILSMYESDEYVAQALANGAKGYILKDAAPDELETAIRTVVSGGTYLSSVVSQQVLGAYVQQLRGEKSAAVALSPRQREVLQLIALGHSTKEIARCLDLSIKTVETHRTRLMQQLDIHEITGLVRYALRTGLISDS